MKPVLSIANPSIVRTCQPRACLCLALALLLEVCIIAPAQAADGPAGLIKDIFSGATGSNPEYLTNVNGILFFVADDGVHGAELWKSDGTAAGTMLVKDIFPGSTSSQITELTAVSRTLFFAAADGTAGYELWKSDGTTAGTMLVKDIYPGAPGSVPKYLTNVNGRLFFVASDSNGMGLWKSDGTAGSTVLVKKIELDLLYQNFYPGQDPLKSVGDVLFFATSNGYTGASLWRTDGTEAGTIFLKRFPRPYAPHSEPAQFSLNRLTDFDGTLFFNAYNGRDFALWKSDGTPSGTTMLTNKAAFDLETTSTALFFTTISTISEPQGVEELWRTDGTVSGTTIVHRFPYYRLNPSLYSLTRVGEQVFFFVYTLAERRELWKSDGTDQGTAFFKDIGDTSIGISGIPMIQVRQDGRLLFASMDAVGTGLWESNGTERGTIRLQSIPPSVPSYKLPKLVMSGMKVFFVATDSQSGTELWTLDINALSAPIASDTTLIARAGMVVTGVLDAVDLEGDALTYTIVNNGAKGTALITNPATGAFTYTPNSNASGEDRFTFQVSDGTYISRVATVTLLIAPEIIYLPIAHP